MAIIRPNFRTRIVDTIAENIFYNRANYYFFLGKIEPWDNETSVPVDVPLTANDEKRVRDGIVYVKKIMPNDVSLLIPRINWSPGIVYDSWDDQQDMKNQSFYCMNDLFQVFKCLDNGNGLPSTIKPVKPITSGDWSVPLRTSDGYTWKYMYDIPQYKRNKFLTPSHIPVQQSITNAFYNSGGIDEVFISYEGRGYEKDQQTQIVVSLINDNGFISSVDEFTHGITSIDLEDSMIGTIQYLTDMRVFIASNGGSGAEIEILHGIDEELGQDVITGIEILQSGLGYSVNDKVFIVRDAELEPIVSQDTGSILDVIIRNPGSGYIVDPNDIINTRPRLFVTNPEGTGHGKYNNNPEAVLIPIVDYIETSSTYGQIIDVIIEDPGVSYATNSSTNILVQGDGTNAKFTPVISDDGRIVDVIVEDPGQNYTYADLKVINRSVPEEDIAILKPIFYSNNFLSDQAIVEQLAQLNRTIGSIYSIKVDVPGTGYTLPTEVIIDGTGSGATATANIDTITGTITSIDVISSGSGYNPDTASILIRGNGYGATAIPVINEETGELISINLLEGGVNYSYGPQLTIHGDGSGLEAYPIVNEVNGSIERVIITSYGSGYSYASITVEDPSRINPNHTNAELRPILSPCMNHGSNAVIELLSNTAVVYSVIQDIDVLNLIKQDYRQYGILVNPIENMSYRKTDVLDEMTVFDFEINDFGAVQPDDVLVHNDIKYRVVGINTSLNTIRLLQLSSIYKEPDLSSNHYFTDINDSGKSYYISSLVSSPTIDKYSGSILYISNREAFIPDDEHIISIRTYIEI